METTSALGDFAPGDHILLVDERDREYLVRVPPPGETVRVKGESFDSATLCAQHDGGLLVSPQRRRYLTLRPTLQQLVMNMPRAAQIIYPKDLGLILMWGDVAPGMRVAEVGCGHGALTMTLLRALGPEGRLTSFEVRRDHLNRTRKNIARYLGEEALARWTPVLADPCMEGLGSESFHRLFTDIPEPWNLLEAAVASLEPGGVWVAYVPTVLQMSRLVESLDRHRHFCLARAFECLQRFWHVRGLSVRPQHEMKAHTGFIIVCRRRWIEPTSEEATPPSPAEPAEEQD
jgi:tRNA (adenine57-N1/adenine58-N1)-methyltransferase